MLIIILVCCIIKRKGIKSSSHSRSFTTLTYEKKPAKDDNNFKPTRTNPMPKPPRTGAYDWISCEDIPGTLSSSRSSTRQTYLFSAPEYSDGYTSHLTGDGHEEATLPRSETDWTRPSYRPRVLMILTLETCSQLLATDQAAGPVLALYPPLTQYTAQ